MSETILIIVFAVIIFGSYFLLRKTPQPLVSYIRIAMAILLLALVWFTWGVTENQWWAQFIITLLAISSLVREFFNLKKFYSKN